MKGKPLWFLVLVVGSWTAGRVAVLWPESDAALLRPIVGHAEAARPIMPLTGIAPPGMLRDAPTIQAASAQERLLDNDHASSQLRPVGAALVLGTSASAPGRPFPETPRSAPIGLPAPRLSSTGSRWSGSAWLIARDGGRASSLLSPLLGGSQAGVRIVYAIGDDRRAAVFGRAAGPLGRGPAELVLGTQWRPSRLPLTAYVEGRLLGGRVSPAAGVFGGGEIMISRFRLEGYGQAGVIARGGVSGFGDGQVRLTRRVHGIDVGVGAWGAGQRGAVRVDIGPSAAVALPIAPLNLRLTLDWRQRVAGDARPASGPALSLGADF